MKSKIPGLLWKPLDKSAFDKGLILIGHFSFLIMAIFSLVYYQERMLHFDTADYAFNLLYSGDFHYRKGREVAILLQLLPLGAFKAGADLPTILQLYSLSFVLFYYLIFIIIVHGFKNPLGGIFLMLAMVLTLRYKFYAPVGEVVIALSTIGLLAGWVTKNKEHFKWLPQWANWLVGCLIIFFISKTHPFAYFSTLIVLGFVIVFFRRWKDLPLWGMVLFALGSMFMTYRQISQDGYETGRAAPIFNAVEILSEFTELYSWNRVFWYFDTEYALPLAVFLFSLIFMAVKKKWFSSLYLLLCFSALVAVIVVTYSYLDTPIYLMIDGYMAHIGVILALPITFFLLSSKRPVWVALVCLLLIFSFDRIRNKRKFYQERQAYFMALIEEHTTEDNRKLLAHMRDFNWEKLWMPWPVGIETLMMSTLENPENPATIYIQRYGQEADLSDPDLFLSVHYDPYSVEPEELPQHLFPLKRGTYKKIVLPK